MIRKRQQKGICEARAVQMLTNMNTTSIRKIDFPQNDSPAQLPQYVLELKDVFVGKDGAVLDSKMEPIHEAMQSAYEWNRRYPDKVTEIIKSAKESIKIVELPQGVDYVNCLSHLNLYPYGHLWDNIQPLQKIETLKLNNPTLLINRDSDHTNELSEHFRIFGYDNEHQKVLSFENINSGTIYRVPKLWYSSMPAPLAHWVPGTVEWMRNKYKPNPEAKPTKLYLSRNNISRRGVLNEEEVRCFLTKQGFTVFEGNEELKKVIELFSNAQVIVGSHGSAFKNSLFSLGDPLIVEFCPDRRMNKSFFNNSISAGHLKHEQMTVKCDDNYNIEIDIDLLKSLINEEKVRGADVQNTNCNAVKTPESEASAIDRRRYLIYNALVRGSGIGHLFYCYNYGLKLALQNNLVFLPTLSMPGHGLGRGGKVESFFGWQDCSRLIEEVRGKKDLDRVEFTNCINKADAILAKYRDRENIIFEIPYLQFNNHSTGDFSTTKGWFLEKYKTARSKIFKPSHYVKGSINIAVHIRRGDVLKNLSYNKDRILPDSYFSTIIDKLKDILKNVTKPIMINVYSETKDKIYLDEKGEPADLLKVFRHNNVKLFLDNDPYETLRNMIDADILVASPSGFSTVASIFSDGICLLPYVKKGYDRRSITVRKDYTFDSITIKERFKV